MKRGKRNITAHHIVLEILDMKQKSIEQGWYGPWELYLPARYIQFLALPYSCLYPKNKEEQKYCLGQSLFAIQGIIKIIIEQGDASPLPRLKNITHLYICGVAWENIKIEKK